MNDRFGLDSRIITPYSPLAGMGFVPRLTTTEVNQLSSKRLAKIHRDLLWPADEIFDTMSDSEKNYLAINGRFSKDYLNTSSLTQEFLTRRKAYIDAAILEKGSDTPIAVLNQYAGSLRSLDIGKTDFDRYQNFTTKYLTLIKNLTANGVMDSAATFIQSRVACYPLEVPFFGQLSIYDIKLDNMLSMDNLIDTVKNTKWDDVSRMAISTFGKERGIADYGVKALNTAVDMATSVATLSSTIGAVGFATGVSTLLAAVVPWVLAVIALIAIAESLYSWLSGQDDEDKQYAQYDKASEETNYLTEGIQDLLLLSLKDTNLIKNTVNLRLTELSAYGSGVRDSLWKDCTAITRSDSTPSVFCADQSAVRADGTKTALVPIRAFSKKALNMKKVMMFKVDYLKSIHQYLSGMEDIGDRRLAFEMLGMSTLPNSVAFSRGLWDSDSYKSNPLKVYKPPVLSRAQQAAIQAAQPIRAKRMAESAANSNARIAAYAKAQSPSLTQYMPLYKQAAKTEATEKKSIAPLLIGAAAASAVYVYYNR